MNCRKCVIIGVVLLAGLGAAAIVALVASVVEPRRSQAAPGQTSEAPAPPNKIAGEEQTPAAWRGPVAIAILDDGGWLYVACRDRGSIVAIDGKVRRITRETKVGLRLAGLVALPGGAYLATVDEESRKLLLLKPSGEKIEIVCRIDLGENFPPSDLVVDRQGKQLAVSSAFGRGLAVVDCLPPQTAGGPPRLSLRWRSRLEFAPRRVVFSPDETGLVVGDAFGGRLAVLDRRTGKPLWNSETTMHNIAALVVDRRNETAPVLLVAAQVADSLLPATAENVAGGRLIRNVVQRFRFSAALGREAALIGDGEIALDEADRGAGDPTDIALVGQSQLAVALGGVNEVLILSGRSPGDGRGEAVRMSVGQRPVRLLTMPGKEQLVVCNQLDDSLTILPTASGKAAPPQTVPLGERPKETSQHRGERLFFDARLSIGARMSCHSCHTEGHTSGRLFDTLGDNSYGTPKRTLTLRGVAATYRWAWNGRFQSLHDQVAASLEQTMHSEHGNGLDVNDLVTFLHTLRPPPPLSPAGDDPDDRRQIERGRKVFDDRGCGECHIPPLVYTSNEVFDVGLADERGQRKFNPPSLRGVSQEARYFHDNRAGSLLEVFSKFGHPQGEKLSGRELSDLVRFLQSL